jgi:hypothetical protein
MKIIILLVEGMCNMEVLGYYSINLMEILRFLQIILYLNDNQVAFLGEI